MVGYPGTLAAAGPLLPGSSSLASLHPQVPGISQQVTAQPHSPAGWLWRVDRVSLSFFPQVKHFPNVPLQQETWLCLCKCCAAK